MQHALSHALATSGISPTEDKGRIPNVINHLALRKQGYQLDDLKRLCWIWSWNGVSVDKQPALEEEEDNPFMVSPLQEKDWCIGSFGVIVTPTTLFSKEQGKRIPVYGIGVEVEMDLNKGLTDGMAAVARWTADGTSRKAAVHKKLTKWVSLHTKISPLPLPPMTRLPKLEQPGSSQVFAIPQATSRPSSPTKLLQLIKTTPSSTPRRRASPVKGKRANTDPSARLTDLIPFPIEPGQVPQTPSRKVLDTKDIATPSSRSAGGDDRNLRTPASERRSALYERVRQRSLSNTPTSSPSKSAALKDGFKAMSASLMKRRCLLGRLPGIAESVWM